MLNPSGLGVVRARSRSRSRTRIGYPNPQERPCMCLLNIEVTYLLFCHHLSNVICSLTNESWRRTWPIMNNSLIACKMRKVSHCSLCVLQDGEVDRATIEEYVELEKKIAGAETHSPALILQQKKDQLVRRRKRTFGQFKLFSVQGHLDERIKQQEQSVAALQDQT